MRWDRSITLNLVHPLRRALGLTRPAGHEPMPGYAGAACNTAPLPILMYHSISEEPEPGVAPYYQTNTSPAKFAEQLAVLAEDHYWTQWLAPLSQRDQDGWPWQPKTRQPPVLITFDDGYRNFYTEAWPVLRRHGYTATMFLPTAYIAEERRSFKGQECLTWGEVRELHAEGVEFGSHTVSHPRLVDLGWNEIEAELADSKSRIEDNLQVRVTTFAYPYAFPQANREFARRFRVALKTAGYECCVTTEVGRATVSQDPYRWKRLPVNTLDDAALFRAKLAGSYDWLAWPQAAVKRLKSIKRGTSNAPGAKATAQGGTLKPEI